MSEAIKQCAKCGVLFQHTHYCLHTYDLSGHNPVKNLGKKMPKQNVWVKAKEQVKELHSSTESEILSTVNPEAPPKDKLEAAYHILKKYWQCLPGHTQKFAADMVKVYEKPGHGTAAQQFWLEKKANEAKKAAMAAGVWEAPEGVEEDEPIAAEQAEPGEQFNGFEKIYEMFKHASANGKLKNPKINLKLPNNTDLLLYMAGPKSKKPGVINLTDGKPYDQSTWYGRIYPDGKWEQPKNYKEKMVVIDAKDIVHSMLHELANDPVAVATKYGKLTGKCCFCKKKLDDDHSLGAGFGPVCAEKYGMKGDWKKAINPMLLEKAKTAEPGALKTLLAAKMKQATKLEEEPTRISAPKTPKKDLFLF